MQVAGVDHRLYASVADTVGYTGLFAALMGRLHPLGILLSGIVFAMLLRGGDSLQIGAGVSPEIISALVGLILLLIAVRASPRLKMARA
jgi:simple sugar transport system permease protein